MKKLLLSLFVLSAVAFGQQAQPATPVQQTATHVDTCTPINGNASSGSQATLTIPAPPASQFIYITELDIEMMNAAAVATGQTDTITSTNLNSTQWVLATTTAIGTGSSLVMNYSTTLKAVSPATKVTIVGPAGVTGLLQNINACYYYGY